MSLLEQQNVLTKIYADPAFRESFYRDPLSVGYRQGLSAVEIRGLVLMAPDEVAFFSQSLVWKRFHDVEKILPLLKRTMGDQFRTAFFEFTATFTPTSIRKHHEDAVRFCEYVIEKYSDIMTSDTAGYERAKQRFFGGGRDFSICRAHLAQPVDSSNGSRRKRLGYAVWLRLGKHRVHFHV